MRISHTAIIAVSMMLSAIPAVAGDIAAGKATFNSKGCTGCHGIGGHSQLPANPVLAGKGADFIRQQLTDFRSGVRQNPTMNAMAGMLSKTDIANIAAYLGTQK